jgi:hypothetical protein
MSVVAVATTAHPELKALTVARESRAARIHHVPGDGIGNQVTRRLSINTCTSSKSTLTGLNSTPPIVHAV